jgi:hypothetical protein
MPGLNKEERTKDGCQYAASPLVSTKKNYYLQQLRNIPGIASPVKKKPVGSQRVIWQHKRT